MTVEAILLLALLFGADPRPGAEWATGPKLATEWDRLLTGVFENAELRDVLRRLGPERHLAVVLDRRIDPNQTVAFTIRQEPLRKGLARCLESVSAELVLTANVAYVGPTEQARWLRTAIDQSERTMAADSIGRGLTVRKTVAWDDLTSPREILKQVATTYNVQLENFDTVPHDLWAAATLPNATPAEALTLVLIQLDLGWTWEPKGRRVTLTAWQPPELIERSYQPRGKATVASLMEDWRTRLPELSLNAGEKTVIVRGRVEDHEQVTKWLSGSVNRGGPTDAAAPTPLSQRRFTLSEKNVSARAVLKELEKSGAEIVLDEDSLTAAQVDLDRTVSVQVQKVNIDEFLKAVIGPLNAAAEVDGLTITVRGKP